MRTFRSPLALLLVTVVLTFRSLVPEAVAQTRELVIAAWGGPYEEGWRKSLIPKFEKANNAKVIWVPGVSSQTVSKLVAQRANPEIDMALLDAGPHLQLVGLGIVDKIDVAKLSNAPKLSDLRRQPGDFGIGFSVDGAGIFYNTKIFAANGWPAPTSWLDLYRPEFKGKVIVQNISNLNGLCLLLALNRIGGGKESNIDPGFAKMKELVPQLVTFDNFGETPTLTQQGVVAIGSWSVVRVATLASSGVPVEFVYPKEGVCGSTQVATIIKGRPNADLAYKFIDLLLSKEEQENTARYVGLGPLHKDARVDEATAKRVIYGSDYLQKVWEPDWQAVNANRAAWTERWNKEIERR